MVWKPDLRRLEVKGNVLRENHSGMETKRKPGASPASNRVA